MSAEDRVRMLRTQQLLLDYSDVADVEVFERARRATLWDSIRFDLTLVDGFECEAILIPDSSDQSAEDVLCGTVYVDLFTANGQHFSSNSFFDAVDILTVWAEHLAITIYNTVKTLRVTYHL